MFGKFLSGLQGQKDDGQADFKGEDVQPVQVSFADGPISPDSIDPSDFVPSDQRVMLQGTIWKLNSDGDPTKSECWLKRMMWLTSAGGLFYFSHKHSKPLGRHIRGLKLKPVQYLKNQFAFEVHLPNMGSSGMRPTVLATDTAEERDDWIRHLVAFEPEPGEADDELSPLDVFGRLQNTGPRRGRRSSLEGLAAAGVEGGGVIAGFTSGPLAPSRTQGDGRSSCGEQLEPGAHQAGASLAPPPQPAAPKPMSASRRRSQVSYAEKAHTALLIDWDDTIFPTTWVREDCGLNWKRSVDAQLEPSPRKTLIVGLLEKFFNTTDEFFKGVLPIANIFIVTLSKRPWVETSARNFLPGIGRILEQNQLKVIYAQEYVTDRMSKEYAHGDEFKSSEQVAAFWTRVKAEAMTKELEKFHSESGITWKNIISLGDSDFERYGMIAAGKDYIKREVADGGQVLTSGATAEAISRDGRQLKLRTKTVKMLGEPTVEELTAQLTLLTRWLPHMVRQDSGFDIEIDNTDDDAKLMALHKQITGEEETLSWGKLAGMADS